MEQVNQSRLVENFSKIVSIPSESGFEQPMQDFLIDFFQNKGYETVVDDVGLKLGTGVGNLLVKIPGKQELPTLLFSAHMDTVVPGVGIVVKEENGVLKSAGDTILAADDKAGIAALLEVTEVLHNANISHPPVEMLFTVGEETGLWGSRLFNYDLLEAVQGYVLDHSGPPGNIVIKSPCQYELTFKTIGKSAHAGINPEEGVNAIHVMAQALSALPTGRIDEETTCNFGMISGGAARNIVPNECVVDGEARSLNRHRLEMLIEDIQKKFTDAVNEAGGIPEFKKVFMFSEATLDKDAPVVKLAALAAEQAGLPVVLANTGGGSDASIINDNGIPTANLGVGMSSVHTTEEYITVKDLVDTARLILNIILLAR